MNVWYKPRLQSVDNIIKTQVLGGEVSPKQIDAVQEEALDVVLAALNGEAGMSGPDIPFLCAALHFWRDELIERMRREHPDDLEAEKAAYIMMKRHWKRATGISSVPPICARSSRRLNSRHGTRWILWRRWSS